MKPKPPAAPAGKRFVAARLTMSVDGFVELLKLVENFKNILMSQGAIKQEQIAPGSDAVN